MNPKINFKRELRKHGKLGDWIIVEELGEGAFGAVFLAERLQVDGQREKAAIKVLLPGGLGDERLFVHEYNILRKINSPYLIRLLGSGIEPISINEKIEPIRWFAMEEIRGLTLQKDIREHGLLDKQEWLELAHDLLSAVAELHSSGIIHKDIKPANIMRFSRRSILADVGAASFVGITDPGDEPIATVQFAAPEQFDGTTNPESLGYEVDLFAVANTLVHVSTGVMPWDLPTQTQDAYGRLISPAEGLLNNMKSFAPRLEGLDSDQKRIVEPMLSLQPHNRGSALQALEFVKSLLPDASSRKGEQVNFSPVPPAAKPSPRNRFLGQSSASKSSNKAIDPNASQCSWLATLLLAIFLGSLGAHHFYTRKIGLGVIYFLTMGFCGIGWLVDVILIATKQFRDNDGKLVLH